MGSTGFDHDTRRVWGHDYPLHVVTSRDTQTCRHLASTTSGHDKRHKTLSGHTSEQKDCTGEERLLQQPVASTVVRAASRTLRCEKLKGDFGRHCSGTGAHEDRVGIGDQEVAAELLQAGRLRPPRALLDVLHHRLRHRPLQWARGEGQSRGWFTMRLLREAVRTDIDVLTAVLSVASNTAVCLHMKP